MTSFLVLRQINQALNQCTQKYILYTKVFALNEYKTLDRLSKMQVVSKIRLAYLLNKKMIFGSFKNESNEKYYGSQVIITSTKG
jgi:hypothetical protein